MGEWKKTHVTGYSKYFFSKFPLFLRNDGFYCTGLTSCTGRIGKFDWDVAKKLK